MKQKNRVRQMLEIWICALVICLGVVLPSVNVRATDVAQVSFSVRQILDIKGIEAQEDVQEFIYVLEDMENKNPLPQGSEDNQYLFSLKGNQSIQLETLAFTQAGEYHYQLRLKENKIDPAFTCDEEIYEITVYVTERMGELRAYVMAVNTAGLKNEELIFTHSYEQTEPTQPDPVKPNDTDNTGNPNDTGNGTPNAPSSGSGGGTGNDAPSGTGGKGFAGGVKTGDVMRMTGIFFLMATSMGIIVVYFQKAKITKTQKEVC